MDTINKTADASYNPTSSVILTVGGSKHDIILHIMYYFPMSFTSVCSRPLRKDINM